MHPSAFDDASQSDPILAWNAGRRALMLPRLVPVSDDLADASRVGRLAVIRLLGKALRSERRRGRAGHWTYALDRHAALRQAFDLECAAFRARFGRG